jgi:putative hydrolase
MMAQFPFGFGKPDDDQPGFDFGSPADLSAALHRFADLLSWSGGTVNWDLARDVARQSIAADDVSVTEADQRDVAESLRLADLWLEPHTELPGAIRAARAWSRAEWIEATLPTWRELVEPVAARVVEAFGSELSAGLAGEAAGPDAELPAQLQQLTGPLAAMMRQVGGVMYGGQVGQALGALARDVVSSTDVGLPLAGAGQAALLPAGVTAFAAGLDVPLTEVRIFLALREAAYHRLYAGTPWLRSRLIGVLEEYARGITIDTERIRQAMESIDPTHPETLQEALTGGLFEPQRTPAQQATLDRLETLLALIEGWVDEVTDQAAREHLPAAAGLIEMVRRRRATGGPAEQTFAALVGLELRPRRLRDAAALWAAVRHARSVAGRDALWRHPDLLPTAEDLADPLGFVEGLDQQ